MDYITKWLNQYLKTKQDVVCLSLCFNYQTSVGLLHSGLLDEIMLFVVDIFTLFIIITFFLRRLCGIDNVSNLYAELTLIVVFLVLFLSCNTCTV